MAHNVAALVRLMLVTDDALVESRDLLALAKAAERGGASAVQLRLKSMSPRELVNQARALIDGLSIPVLVNDRPDVAIAAGAAGVHLGPDDVPVAVIRRMTPPGFIIGASVGSAKEAADAGGADYWGIGPWRGTATKGDAGAALGADGFRQLVGLSGGRPCLAIGGVRPQDVAAVRAAGGSGVAVVSGILREEDVEAGTRQYADALQIR
jgi:thiamine-phosphate pyrophosphorylase